MTSALLTRSVLVGLFVLFCGIAPAWSQPPSLPGTKDFSKITSGEYTLDKSHANVVFKINHLGFSNYIGRFNHFDAKLNFDAAAPEKSKLDVTIDVNSIDTNHEKLETDLKTEKFFNTAKFPTATFKSTTVTRSGDKGTVIGDFTMMGVTKPVTLNVAFHGAGVGPFSKKETLGFHATTTIKRSDWGLNALVPMISDEVQLEIEVEFNSATPVAAQPAAATPVTHYEKKKIDSSLHDSLPEEKYLE